MTFEDWAMANHGIPLQTVIDLGDAANSPEAVKVLTKWAVESSEQYRVRAITSEGNSAVEAMGRWKALQEFSDIVKTRLADYHYMLQEYSKS